MKRVVKLPNGSLEYSLIRSQRSANCILKVLPGGEVRLYAPAQTQIKRADTIILNNLDLIRDMQYRLDRSLAENRLRHPVSPGSSICIEGTPRRISIINTSGSSAPPVEITDSECILHISSPADQGLQNDCDDDHIRATLKQFLSKLALIRIRERLDVYAPMLGVQYGRVTVRDQRSRWGSCSAKHNLNFNWKLIMAPPEVLDYVVIHELCHLIEFNHSARFWDQVSHIQPEYTYWKKWLKDHGNELGLGQ